MLKKIAICPKCNTKINCTGEIGQKVECNCPECGKKGFIRFTKENTYTKEDYKEVDFYPLNEPYAYVRILRDISSFDNFYKLIEPILTQHEQEILQFIQDTLLKSIEIRLDELENEKVDEFLSEHIQKIIKDYNIELDDVLLKKIKYFINRDFIGYGKIDALMRDPNIEDISCDGSNLPIFLFHRKFASLKSNIEFKDEEELSAFVILLAQKCGKHISIAEPMLDATMPDGSRIQMTLSTEVTTKGSTFTIRKFRADPITPTDLIEYNTFSVEMIAYLWMAVENGVNALIAGGTAAGKTSALNAMCLFIPRESKIVSIEETREINLPHPNWIPGVARSGFGEVVNDKVVGEIDLFDLMKAALRQRPEYILVGEIRGREAYVLFQAMATGHTTYSTFHADSTKSLIHRLEGKPIEIPRIMIQSLDVVSIQISAKLGNKHVRRCKQIVEIVDIDPATKEILTNEVFRWDPVEDRFIYSGKSYILERIRSQYDMSKEDITTELKQRVEILEWLRKNNIREFKDVAGIIAIYSEKPDEIMKKIRSKKQEIKKKEGDSDDIKEEPEESKIEEDKEQKKDEQETIVERETQKIQALEVPILDNASKSEKIDLAQHDEIQKEFEEEFQEEFEELDTEGVLHEKIDYDDVIESLEPDKKTPKQKKEEKKSKHKKQEKKKDIEEKPIELNKQKVISKKIEFDDVIKDTIKTKETTKSKDKDNKHDKISEKRFRISDLKRIRIGFSGRREEDDTE